MKKLIALLLALVMVLGLVACASKTTDETPKTDDSAAAPADTETTDNTAEPADTETTDTAEETTGEERPYYVRDAKDVTGTLTVYTTIGETEQQALRAEYIAAYRRNLRAQLDNMVLVDENGNERPLKKKK